MKVKTVEGRYSVILDTHVNHNINGETSAIPFN